LSRLQLAIEQIVFARNYTIALLDFCSLHWLAPLLKASSPLPCDPLPQVWRKLRQAILFVIGKGLQIPPQHRLDAVASGAELFWVVGAIAGG
jgi:hypothetical protein